MRLNLVTFDSVRAITNVDIKLTKKGPCVLEGAVTDSNGLPVPNAWVLIHHTEMLFDNISLYTDQQGKFRTSSIGPGDYLIHVDAEPFGYVRSRQTVTIESGMKKVDFTLTHAVTIKGNFVDESGNPFDIGPNALGSAHIKGISDSNNLIGVGVTISASSIRNMRGWVYEFCAGQGDYHYESMDFPTQQSFVIQGLQPEKLRFGFDPKNLGFKLKS